MPSGISNPVGSVGAQYAGGHPVMPSAYIEPEPLERRFISKPLTNRSSGSATGGSQTLLTGRFSSIQTLEGAAVAAATIVGLSSKVRRDWIRDR